MLVFKWFFYPTLPKHQMSWDGKVIFCAYLAECKCHGLQVAAYSVRASKKVKKMGRVSNFGKNKRPEQRQGGGGGTSR